MQVYCPRCGKRIAASDINMETSIARCADCGEVFNFASALGTVTPAAGIKPQVEMPKGFTVSQQLDELVVDHRWFALKYIGLLIICLFWYSFLVSQFGNELKDGAPLVILLFDVIEIAFGVNITYATIGGFVNHTELRVSRTRVTVRHYPLPWPGNRKVLSHVIAQVFCMAEEHRNIKGVSYTYDVFVEEQGGRRFKLVSGLEDEEQALFIEQQIEQYLGIADRAVPGEIRLS